MYTKFNILLISLTIVLSQSPKEIQNSINQFLGVVTSSNDKDLKEIEQSVNTIMNTIDQQIGGTSTQQILLQSVQLSQSPDIQWELQKTFFRMFIISEADYLLQEAKISENDRLKAETVLDSLVNQTFVDYEAMNSREKSIIRDFILNFYPEYTKLQKDQQQALSEDLLYFSTLPQQRKENLFLYIRQNVSDYLMVTQDLPSIRMEHIVQSIDQLIRADKSTPNRVYNVTGNWTAPPVDYMLQDIASINNVSREFDKEFYDYLRNTSNTDFNRSSFDNLLDDLLKPEQVNKELLRNKFETLVNALDGTSTNITSMNSTENVTTIETSAISTNATIKATTNATTNATRDPITNETVNQVPQISETEVEVKDGNGGIYTVATIFVVFLLGGLAFLLNRRKKLLQQLEYDPYVSEKSVPAKGGIGKFFKQKKATNIESL